METALGEKKSAVQRGIDSYLCTGGGGWGFRAGIKKWETERHFWVTAAVRSPATVSDQGVSPSMYSAQCGRWDLVQKEKIPDLWGTHHLWEEERAKIGGENSLWPLPLVFFELDLKSVLSRRERMRLISLEDIHTGKGCGITAGGKSSSWGIVNTRVVWRGKSVLGCGGFRS